MSIFDSKKAFIKAARTGDIKTVTRYVSAYRDDKSMNLNAQDKNGITAMSHAARRGDVAMLKVMVQAGLNIEAADDNGWTPLNAAIEAKQPDAALALLEAGANAKARFASNIQPLHAAAYHGLADVTKALIEKGVELDAVIVANGNTALHWALINGHAAVAEMLVKAGARTDLPNHQGKTAITVAHAKGEHMVRLIKAASPLPKPVSSDTWIRTGDDQVMRVGNYPEAGRKLTEIFNFSSRERIVITENLKTGAENMTPPESFDRLTEEAVRKAIDAFRKLGGSVDEQAVLNPPGQAQKRLLRP